MTSYNCPVCGQYLSDGSPRAIRKHEASAKHQAAVTAPGAPAPTFPGRVSGRMARLIGDAMGKSHSSGFEAARGGFELSLAVAAERKAERAVRRLNEAVIDLENAAAPGRSEAETLRQQRDIARQQLAVAREDLARAEAKLNDTDTPDTVGHAMPEGEELDEDQLPGGDRAGL